MKECKATTCVRLKIRYWDCDWHPILGQRVKQTELHICTGATSVLNAHSSCTFPGAFFKLHIPSCTFPVTMSTASGSHVFFFPESAYAIVLLGGNARHVRWRHDKQAYTDVYFHIAPSGTMGLSICCSCIDRRRIRSSRF